MRQLTKLEIDDLKKKISATGGYGMKYISRLNDEIDPRDLLNEMSIFKATREKLIQQQQNHGRSSTVRTFLDAIPAYAGWADGFLRALDRVGQGELANFLVPGYIPDSSEEVQRVRPHPDRAESPPPPYDHLQRSTSDDQGEKLRKYNERLQHPSTNPGRSELPPVYNFRLPANIGVNDSAIAPETQDSSEYSAEGSLDGVIRQPFNTNTNPSFEVEITSGDNNFIEAIMLPKRQEEFDCKNKLENPSMDDYFVTMSYSTEEIDTIEEINTMEISEDDILISSSSHFPNSSDDGKIKCSNISTHEIEKTTKITENSPCIDDTSALENMNKSMNNNGDGHTDRNHALSEASKKIKDFSASGEFSSRDTSTSIGDCSSQQSQIEEDPPQEDPPHPDPQQNVSGWFNNLFNNVLDRVIG